MHRKENDHLEGRGYAEKIGSKKTRARLAHRGTGKLSGGPVYLRAAAMGHKRFLILP